MGEEEARNRGYDVDVKVLEFSKVPRAIIGLKEKGLIKLMAEKNSGKLLGVHVLSSHGAEIIHKAVIAIKYGLRVEDLASLTCVYPTLSESIKLIAQSFTEDITKLSCCAE